MQPLQSDSSAAGLNNNKLKNTVLASQRVATDRAIAKTKSRTPSKVTDDMSLFATRVSSFAVGFAAASAGGFWVLKQDIEKSHQELTTTCSTLAARVAALEKAGK